MEAINNTFSGTMMGDSIEIKITQQNLFFLQKQFTVKDHKDFFPFDTIGAMNPANNIDKPYLVRTIKLETDAGFSIITDIVEKSFVFRNRSYTKGTSRYMKEKGIKAGDTIVIEKIGPYDFKMYVKGDKKAKDIFSESRTFYNGGY
ncbi:MAG: hypothetical protein U9R41_01720 [Candidatus Marinimicrobia bacterium]|nr:hypothetical protein [Candidatus Neomarinimicrobiota bacterium]